MAADVGTRFARAVEWAADLHADQTRNGGEANVDF